MNVQGKGIPVVLPPYAARLEVLEQIRQQHIAWKHDPQPRFQRVLTITKR